MDNLINQFTRLDNQSATITLQHIVFGIQKWRCDCMHPFCDDGKIGIRMKKNDIFILLKDIKSFLFTDEKCEISTDKKSILIELKKF